MESTSPTVGRFFAPQGYGRQDPESYPRDEKPVPDYLQEGKIGNIYPRDEKKRVSDDDHESLVTTADGEEDLYIMDPQELATTVEVLTKLRQSILLQSGRSTPRRAHSRKPSRNHPGSPPAFSQAIDPAYPMPTPQWNKQHPGTHERKISFVEPPHQREPKQSGWRKSLMPSETINRRASGMLFGTGGPATEINPVMSQDSGDWNPKGGDGVHPADPALINDYLYRLSKALMLYGAPGHRIERYLTMTAHALHADVEFFYLPDHLTLYLENKKTEVYQSRLIKGAGTDLGRWLDVHNISKHIIRDGMRIEDAIHKLKQIEARKPLHSEWFLFLIYGLAGIGIAPFAYGARFVDLPLCFLLGTGLGILQVKLAPRNHLYSVLFEVSAAVLFSFLARMLGSIKNADGDRIFCYSAISEAAINLIQPGYWITNACLELMNRQIATSGARITYAVVYAVLLAYGIAIGGSLYGLIDHDAVSAQACSDPISPYWNLFFVPFFCTQVGILGGAKWSQLPAMVFITFAMYCAFFFTLMFADGSFTVAATMGALTMGLLGNTYARLGRRIEKGIAAMFGRGGNSPPDPESGIACFSDHIGYTCAAASMVPAMIVLVPSGLSNKGSHLGGTLTADAIVRNATSTFAVGPAGEVMLEALPIFFNVIQIGICIAVGLSIGALAVYPFGKSRSWIMSW